MSSQLKARSVLHFLFTKLWSCQSNNVCLQVDGQKSDSCSFHEDEYLRWSLTHIGVIKKNTNTSEEMFQQQSRRNYQQDCRQVDKNRRLPSSCCFMQATSRNCDLEIGLFFSPQIIPTSLVLVIPDVIKLTCKIIYHEY